MATRGVIRGWPPLWERRIRHSLSALGDPGPPAVRLAHGVPIQSTAPLSPNAPHGRRPRPTPPHHDPGRRRGRLQPAHGAGRGRHDGAAAGAPPRRPDAGGRAARRARLQGHGRRRPHRVHQRRQRRGVRHRAAEGDAGAERRPARPSAHPVAHRHQSRRRHGRGQRPLWRRRQSGGAARVACRARRHLRLRRCLSPGAQQAADAVPGPGRTEGQEHRRTRACLSGAGRRRRAVRRRNRRRLATPLRPCRTSRRLPCCRSPT